MLRHSNDGCDTRNDGIVGRICSDLYRDTLYDVFNQGKEVWNDTDPECSHGALMWVTGMSYYALVVGTLSGLIAEFIYRAGNYKSKKLGVIAYAISGIYCWANYFGIFFNAEAYFSTRQNFGQEYIDAVTKMLPVWMCPVLLIVDVLCGIIGGWIGTKALKKHFEKAGIA